MNKKKWVKEKIERFEYKMNIQYYQRIIFIFNYSWIKIISETQLSQFLKNEKFFLIKKLITQENDNIIKKMKF